MEKYSLDKITALGDIGYRTLKGLSRLESSIYQPLSVEKTEQSIDWPGDWIGRTLLGVSLLSMTTGKESAFLEDLFCCVRKLRNQKGYLGNIEELGVFNEQQFSGHNWLLRGLLEYYRWKKDEQALETASDIVHNLYLSAKGYYREYPTQKESHVFAGGKSGTVTGSIVHHWRLSSDTGCAFMCLDGLADYYALTKDVQVKELLEEMISVFCGIDFVELSMQTHASLSATRGIIKFYRETGNRAYLDFVEQFFALYLDYGATANYANFNWFCRATWTEPCAIIDSYILAFDLFCETKNPFYLKTANRIHYNALDFSQRLNGGFGCDICVGPKETVLHADTDCNPLCEAYWCCTMRGGEGLTRIVENLYLFEKDTLYLAQYGDSRFEGNLIHIRQRTTFPSQGNVILEIDSQSDEIRQIALFVPEYAQDALVITDGIKHSDVNVGAFYFIPLHKGKHEILLSFKMQLHMEPCLGKLVPDGTYCYWRGDMILGIETDSPLDDSDFQVTQTDDGQYQMIGHGPFVDLRGNIDMEISRQNMVKSIQIVFK